MATLLLLVAVLLTPHTLCAQSHEVGWVEQFEGPSHQYRLVRAGRQVPVRLFTPVLEGDEVFVLSHSGKLAILLNDGRHIQKVFGESPRVVTGGTRHSSVPQNIVRWAQDLFTPWHDQSLEPAQIAVRGFPDPISMPLLSHPDALLASGDRALTIAWLGGRPPFSLRVTRVPEGLVLTTLENLVDRQARTPRVSLREGRFQLLISDAEGSTLIGQFSVVPGLPALPLPLSSAETPAVIVDTLKAARLAQLEEGRWAFEAYQLATVASSESYPAALLRDRLAVGERPHIPPP